MATGRMSAVCFPLEKCSTLPMLSALSRAIQHIVSTELSSKNQNNPAQMLYCLKLLPVDFFVGSYRHGVNTRPAFNHIQMVSCSRHTWSWPGIYLFIGKIAGS